LRSERPSSTLVSREPAPGRTTSSRRRRVSSASRVRARGATLLALLIAGAPASARNDVADAPSRWPARFEAPKSGLELRRRTRPGAFFDVVGRRAGVFGYENRALEVWAWPLKLVDSFALSFRAEGYPLEFEGAQLASLIEVRPEATVITYSHAAFTVRQTLLVPVDEPGIVMLLEVDSALPLSVVGSFKPRLRLMWPAGLQTGDVGWDEKTQVYSITEESKRFVAVVGCPGAKDLAVMPYQEEPRDVPIRFEVPVPPDAMRTRLVPIVVAGSVFGKERAVETYERLLASAQSLYAANVEHYRKLHERTTLIETPEPRLDTAFAWARVGIDKGLATNPLLGTGLVAGFRTSGESERPGFAWLFGRDALWTALAMHSYGDLSGSRVALEFLRQHQREDGKIPHEVSQSATLVPWFTGYPYPWNAADATPLYVIAHADRWRVGGDLDFVKQSWESIEKAWRFTAGSDGDGNALVENTKSGHGWVEGGDLYPPHEEIYLQGAWIEASRSFAEMAAALQKPALVDEARAWAERTRQAVEATYWLDERGFYAFSTQRARDKPREAEAGPRRASRQAWLDETKDARIVDEDTVLPAVPLWWGLLDATRAQSQIDHLGAAALATDWGTRLLSNASRLYDPLSYHHGSVWPLFTGWASMAAYRHGRPHVGYQALAANALLTFQGALGYVTELLSGDYNAPFSRSSHHQVWSEAMVITPIVRGLFGVEVSEAGSVLRVAPQLPADWRFARLRRISAGPSQYDLECERSPGRDLFRLRRLRDAAAPGLARLELAPAYPRDARVRALTLDGRGIRFESVPVGDVQQVRAIIERPGTVVEVVVSYDPGSDVTVPLVEPEPGATSQGLRVVRARAERGVLRLVLDGLAGRRHTLHVHSPHKLGAAAGVSVAPGAQGRTELRVSFEGPEGTYVRRDLALPLR
jgi:glycogen debranching enzyme